MYLLVTEHKINFSTSWYKLLLITIYNPNLMSFSLKICLSNAVILSIHTNIIFVDILLFRNIITFYCSFYYYIHNTNRIINLWTLWCQIVIVIICLILFNICISIFFGNYSIFSCIKPCLHSTVQNSWENVLST